MPERRNPKLFQVLGRQARQNPLVLLVLAERRLIAFEAKVPQPDNNVHDVVPACTSCCGPIMSATGVMNDAVGHRSRRGFSPNIDCSAAVV